MTLLKNTPTTRHTSSSPCRPEGRVNRRSVSGTISRGALACVAVLSVSAVNEACVPLIEQKDPLPSTSSGSGGSDGMPTGAGGATGSGGSAPTCPGALAECAGVCVDLQHDPGHCGGCDHGCGVDEVCAKGTCSFDCEGGATKCKNTDAQDICTVTAIDPLHCGMCGNVCDADHATSYCAEGACEFECDAGFGDCNAMASDGCETTTSTDKANCGGCDKVCAAGETCEGSVCKSPAAASCKALLTAKPGTPDGVYPIDPDGMGPQPATELFCDMTNGGLTLVFNMFDGAGDDAPNTPDYVVSGWQQKGSGQWDMLAKKVDRDASGNGSAAVSPAFVAALKASAGQMHLKMCLTGQNGNDVTCRQSKDGSLSLTGYNAPNPVLASYSNDTLTFTYARLAGLLGTSSAYNNYTYVTHCVPVTPSFVSPGVGEGEFGGDGCGKSFSLCELPKGDMSGAAIGAVWHGNCGGAWYIPTNPSMVAAWPSSEFKSDVSLHKGFRLYIGL